MLAVTQAELNKGRLAPGEVFMASDLTVVFSFFCARGNTSGRSAECVRNLNVSCCIGTLSRVWFCLLWCFFCLSKL